MNYYYCERCLDSFEFSSLFRWHLKLKKEEEEERATPILDCYRLTRSDDGEP